MIAGYEGKGRVRGRLGRSPPEVSEAADDGDDEDVADGRRDHDEDVERDDDDVLRLVVHVLLVDEDAHHLLTAHVGTVFEEVRAVGAHHVIVGHVAAADGVLSVAPGRRGSDPSRPAGVVGLDRCDAAMDESGRAHDLPARISRDNWPPISTCA